MALAETPFPKAFRSLPGDGQDFDAKLLLLSVRNADKSLKSNDATHMQRLEMMILLAKELSVVATPSSDAGKDNDQLWGVDQSNVAVAIIDEPTFVGKSNALLSSLRERVSRLCDTGISGAQPLSYPSLLKPCLTFLVGMDTLDRLFAPRYYSSEEGMRDSLRQFLSPDGDDSRVICARRLGLKEDPNVVEARTLEAAKEFVDSHRIALVDIDEAVAAVSSSEVRDKISNQHGENSWHTLIPQTIVDYVVRNGLYLQYS